MAPELALSSLRELAPGSVVLDPMAGSGTVLRQATELGHHAIGYDLDPLAVLMARVWTTPLESGSIDRELESVLEEASSDGLQRAELPWLSLDPLNSEFIDYWFAPQQRHALARLALVLYQRQHLGLDAERSAAVEALRVGLSRIIVTKEQGASLARDTSHSRPHRVSKSSAYDVFKGFERSVNELKKRLAVSPPSGGAVVELGDVRKLSLPTASVDAVLTSPPYLNAIDYMRGHRLALIWLGYSISELRQIRSSSIGAERKPNASEFSDDMASTVVAMCKSNELGSRATGMVQRYAEDLLSFTKQIARVLKPSGSATFVVGNSCLKGVFIRNSDGVAHAAVLAGLKVVRMEERDLPSSSRYLPFTTHGALSKRMRTETILTFTKPSL